MFFDRISEFEDLEVTSTTFRATVSQDEPFRFAAYASQDIHASVRITHLFYTPPNSLSDLHAYYTNCAEACKPPSDVVARPQSQVKDPVTLSSSTVPPSLSPSSVLSVVAKVRSLTADNTIASFVIASFPLEVSRLTVASEPLKGIKPLPMAAAAASSDEPLLAALGNTRVAPSDVVRGLNIRLDVDGSVVLEVEGPGRVTFFGEQFSALIPEWMNHHIFSVGKDDEEMPEDDTEDEIDEMYRLVRY